MNSKKVIMAVLLVSGFAINAKDNFLLKDDAYEAPSKSRLSFRKSTSGNILKLKLNAQSPLSAKDWDEKEVNGGGLFLNLGIHFPSSKFLNGDDLPYWPAFNMGYDFEFGSYFRFANVADDKVGIGLRATWLSLSYTKGTVDKDVYRAIQISPLRVGPQVGIAINEVMGIDVFYQIGYNFTDLFGAIDDPVENKDKGLNMTYTGVSHEIGAAFHFRVFSLGLGYRFGNLKNNSYIYDGTNYTNKTDDHPSLLLDNKSSVNNFRITLGFKF